MKFMITFPLTHHKYQERVSRFLETGAPPPDGVTLLGRWITAAHNKGFMLVEAAEAKDLFRFVSEWTSMMDFEVEPVLDDEQASAVLQSMA